MPRPIVAITVIIAAAACDLVGASTDGTIVRDSAGVEIVESSAPRWRAGQEWRVADTPSVSIGAVFGDDPAMQFTRIAGLTRLSDGRIVVADEGSAELRVFDGRGAHLVTGAGKGTGPGEFVRLSGLLRLPGDSLLAIQLMPPRQSLFSNRGTFVRAVEPTRAADSPLPLVASAILDDGTAILDPGFRPVRRLTGTTMDSMTIHTAAPGDDSARALGRFPALRFTGSGRFVGPVAFGPTGVTTARGDRFYVGYPERFEVAAYSADGTLRRLIRRAWSPTPVTEDARNTHIARALRDAPESFRQQYMEALTFAEHFPAYDDLLVDATGRLWVRAAPTDGVSLRTPDALAAHAARWSTFDHDGAWLGDITLPTGFDLVEVGEDYLLGVWYDADEIPFVQVYDLIRE